MATFVLIAGWAGVGKQTLGGHRQRAADIAKHHAVARAMASVRLVALLNLGVPIETGHPWVVTWAFTL